MKVLFVGGYGRSGSTLLDRILGQTEGFFSPGEVQHLRRRVDHVARIPQIAAGPSAAWRRDRDDYVAMLERLYSAIGATTGARVVVDSSKDVSHGWLLTRADVDLSVVQLVRDSRAAAFSWQRRKFNPGNDRDMQRYSPVRAGLEWAAINALTHALRRTGVPFTVLRYDDFVNDPVTSVARVIELTGERARPAMDGREVSLQPGHSVAGNPIRFGDGTVAITSDDEWRARMRPAARRTVSALTLPGLVRYGFLGGRAESAESQDGEVSWAR